MTIVIYRMRLRIMASPAVKRRLSANVRLIIILPALVGVIATYAQGVEGPGPTVENTVRPPAPLMVWRGQSEIGYLRVELWGRTTAGQPLSQDLIINTATDEGRVTYNGMMVQWPSDIKTEPLIVQVFVRSLGDLEERHKRDLSILATLAPDGTLRLYACGSRRFIRPCALKPIE